MDSIFQAMFTQAYSRIWLIMYFITGLTCMQKDKKQEKIP